jgi:hypothetical protein
MLFNSGFTTIKLPLPSKRWWAVALAVALSLIWVSQGLEVLAIIALTLVPVALAVGEKFEFDAAQRRYRVGMHWAHVLNPRWQQLPPVQLVVVKPHRHRQLRQTSYNGLVDEGLRRVFTVLLSVPHTTRGVVVASVKDRATAAEIAAIVAEALQVPWQQA